jgi:hypothetical protein
MSLNHASRLLFAFTMVLITSIICSFFFTTPETTVMATSNATTLNVAENILNSIPEQNESISTFGKIVYGKSGLGTDLTCIKISPLGKKKSSILITFEIHGYEDLLPKDGQKLVEIGNSVAKYFEKSRGSLKNTELYIVPSVNPDGLSHGDTNNGVGRCQVSQKTDINRDFDYNFIHFQESRNYNGKQPFSTPEAKALRNLVQSIKPNAVIDCHGWENTLIGDKAVTNCFGNSLDIYRQRTFSSYDHGYFSAWAGTQGAKSMLLEYPTEAYSKSDIYADKTVDGLKNLIHELD